MGYASNFAMLMVYFFVVGLCIHGHATAQAISQSHSHLRARQSIDVTIAYWRAMAGKTDLSTFGFSICAFMLLIGQTWRDASIVYWLAVGCALTGACIAAFRWKNVWSRPVTENVPPKVEDTIADMDKWFQKSRLLQYLSFALVLLCGYEFFELIDKIESSLSTSIWRPAV